MAQKSVLKMRTLAIDSTSTLINPKTDSPPLLLGMVPVQLLELISCALAEYLVFYKLSCRLAC